MGWFSKLFGGGVLFLGRIHVFEEMQPMRKDAGEIPGEGSAEWLSQSEGVNCPSCRKTWCNGCHPPARGQQCQKCGGQLRCNFG